MHPAAQRSRVLVEAVERSAIPDTQDILRPYEIIVDDEGTFVQYGLGERYRPDENREELKPLSAHQVTPLAGVSRSSR